MRERDQSIFEHSKALKEKGKKALKFIYACVLLGMLEKSNPSPRGKNTESMGFALPAYGSSHPGDEGPRDGFCFLQMEIRRRFFFFF